MSSRCDYKLSKTGQHRRQRARHQGLLVLTLILIGLFGGLLAYIRGDRTPAPATAAAPAAPVASTSPAAPVAPVAPVASTSPAASVASTPPAGPAVVASPTPPPAAAVPVAEPEPVKPKYDFYTELPKRQIDVQSGVAPPGASPSRPPARTQPAVNQLQKPAPPRKNATPATLATASNGKTAKTRPMNARTGAAEPTSNGKTAKTRLVNARTAAAEPASNGKIAKNDKIAKARPVSAGTAAVESARSKPVSASSATKSPTPRPLANNGSKIAVKTE